MKSTPVHDHLGKAEMVEPPKEHLLEEFHVSIFRLRN